MPSIHPEVAPIQETSSRPLGDMEALLKTIGDIGKPVNRDNWAVITALRLNFPLCAVGDEIPYLRRAWQLLRFRHPALGAILREPEPGTDSNQSSLVVEPPDLEEWDNGTFVVCREYADSAEMFFSLHPTPTATCYWLPNSEELAICSSHWRIDGKGLALLFHEFMTTVAELMKTTPVAPLEDLLSREVGVNTSIHPSQENLVSMRSSRKSDADQEDPVLADGGDEMIRTFLQGLPSIGLPTREPDNPKLQVGPGCSDRVETRLDAETTARVVAACRKKGITVTVALHAAIVRVTARFPQHPYAQSYASFVCVDLRRALEATATGKTKAPPSVGLYLALCSFCIDSVLTKGFDEIASGLAVVYGRDPLRFWQPSSLGMADSDEADSSEAVSLLDLAAPFAQRLAPLWDAPLPEGLPPMQQPGLSSMGRLESYIHREYGDGGETKVQVLDYWPGVQVLTQSMIFHAWSWDGALRLGVCFSTTFHDRGFVADVTELVIQELLTGCGLE